MCYKHVPSLLVSHEKERAEYMKTITRLHSRKTQRHVHNYFNLSNCCGSKWCTSTYTYTFNNNIWDVLQRVGHLVHNWTLFSWFLVNSLEKVDTACQAFSLIHCQSCPWQWWTFNLHWVNIRRGLTLEVNKLFVISGVPRPFGAFFWYFITWGPCIFPCCNHAFRHDFHGTNIRQTFVANGWCLGTCLHVYNHQ